MPKEPRDHTKGIEELKAALAKGKAEKQLLLKRHDEIKAQLQEALDGNKALMSLLQNLQTKLDTVIFQTEKRNKKTTARRTNDTILAQHQSKELSKLTNLLMCSLNPRKKLIAITRSTHMATKTCLCARCHTRSRQIRHAAQIVPSIPFSFKTNSPTRLRA